MGAVVVVSYDDQQNVEVVSDDYNLEYSKRDYLTNCYVQIEIHITNIIGDEEPKFGKHKNNNNSITEYSGLKLNYRKS